MEKNISLAEKSFEIISEARKIIEEHKKDNEYADKDLARLDEIIEGYTNAKPMITGSREAAFAAGWMVSMANNAIFLLFRRNVLTPEIEQEFAELPSTEKAMKAYDKFVEEDAATAKELEEKRVAFMNEQHSLDILKAVFGGQSKEVAEQKYKEYQETLAKSLGA